MFSFCPKTAIHSLGEVKLIKFLFFFFFLLLGLIPANPDVVKTFFTLIYTNVTIPYLLYML